MKIAIPVTKENTIDEHFGHCESYNIYTINEKKEIENVENMDSPQGCGCKSNIASVFQAKGISIMLAGGIGMGAINVLNAHGIDVVRGCTGKSDDVLKEFLKGNVADSGSTCQSHEHNCSH